MPPMRKVLLMLALVACGGDDDNTTDASPDGRPVLTLDCPTYCTTIQANCSAANGQYQDMDHCLGTCAGFDVGTSADMGGQNTLGCRLYHAQNAMISGMPDVHCPHAGPAGDKLTGTGICGDPCTSFCALDAKICGTNANPITGVTNRYADTAACMTACAGLDKNVAYSSTAANGNSLACRVNHLTNAGFYTKMQMAAMVNAHCGHTLTPATGVCQ
jgi:hypothetical protein